MKEKIKKLENLRKDIIKEVCIKQWKDAWFYPKYNRVKGWLGTQNIMFVGSNPSYNTFPTKSTDFFYEQLKNNGFENAHLTDLIKIRAKNKEADKVIDKTINEQIKFLKEEIDIIKPKLIVVMGIRAQIKIEKFKQKNKRLNFTNMYHYSSMRFPKYKNRFIRQMKNIKKMYSQKHKTK